jgi:hypothetical protein
VCDVYRPSGERSVSSSAAASGLLGASACNPAPYGGFTSTCDGSGSGGGSTGGTSGTRRCTYAPASPRTSGAMTLALALAVALGAARRRRAP